MEGDSQDGQGRMKWSQDAVYSSCGNFVKTHNRFPTDEEFGQDVDSPGKDPSLPTLDFVERYFQDGLKIVLISEAYSLAGKEPPSGLWSDDESPTMESMPEPHVMPADSPREYVHTSPLMSKLAEAAAKGFPVFGKGSTQDSVAGLLTPPEPPAPEPLPSSPIRREITEPLIVMKMPGESAESFKLRKAAAAEMPGSRVLEPEAETAKLAIEEAKTTRHQTLQGAYLSPEATAPESEESAARPTRILPEEEVQELKEASAAEGRPTQVVDLAEIVLREAEQATAERQAVRTMPLFSPAKGPEEKTVVAAAPVEAQEQRQREQTIPLFAHTTASPSVQTEPAVKAADEEQPTRVVRRDSIAPDRVIMGPQVLMAMAGKMYGIEPRTVTPAPVPEGIGTIDAHSPTAFEIGPESARKAGIGLAATQQAQAYNPPTPPTETKPKQEAKPAEPSAKAPPKKKAVTLQFIPPPTSPKAAEAHLPPPPSLFDEQDFPEDVSDEDKTRPVTFAAIAAAVPVPSKAAEPIIPSEVAAIEAKARLGDAVKAQYVITPDQAKAQPAADEPARDARPSEIFRQELLQQKEEAEQYLPPKKMSKLKKWCLGLGLGLLTVGAGSIYWYSSQFGCKSSESMKQEDTQIVAAVERYADASERDAATTIDTLVKIASEDIAAPTNEEEDVSAPEAASPGPEPLPPLHPVPPVPIPPTPIPHIDHPEQPQPPEVTPVPPVPASPPDKEGCKLRVNMQFDSTQYADSNATQDLAKYVREMVEAGQTRFYVAGFASIETKNERRNDDAPYNVRLATRRAEQVKQDMLKSARRLGKNIDVVVTTYGETEAFGSGVNPEDRTVVVATEPIADPEQSAAAAAKVRGPAGQEYGCDTAVDTGRTASAELPKVMIADDIQTDDQVPVLLASNAQPDNHLPKVMISADLQTEVEQYYARLKQAGNADELDIPVVVEQNYSRETFQKIMIEKLYKEYAFGKTISDEELVSRAGLCGMQDATLEKIQDMYLEMAADRDDSEMAGAEIIIDVDEPFELPVTVEQPRQRYFAGIDQTDVNEALDQILLMESTPRNPEQAKAEQQRAYVPDPEELTKLVYSLANEGFESTDIMRVAAIRGHNIGLNDINRLLERGHVDSLGAKSEVLQALDAIEAAESESREYELPVFVDEPEEELPIYIEPMAIAQKPLPVTRHVDLSEAPEQPITVTRCINLSEPEQTRQYEMPTPSLPPVTMTRCIDLSEAPEQPMTTTRHSDLLEATQQPITVTRHIDLSEPEQRTIQYARPVLVSDNTRKTEPAVTMIREIVLGEEQKETVYARRAA